MTSASVSGPASNLRERRLIVTADTPRYLWSADGSVVFLSSQWEYGGLFSGTM